MTFEFVIRNYGNVTLENVHMTDDLKTAFSLPIAAQFTVLSLESNDFIVNPEFDGDATIELLAEENTLAAESDGKILLKI